jgi:hypothetical protein
MVRRFSSTVCSAIGVQVTCIAVAFAEPGASDPQQQFQALKTKADQAYQAKQFEESAQAYREALSILKQVATDSSEFRRQAVSLHYNVACDEALLGRKKAALAELKQAVDSGDTEWKWALEDADLLPLRGSAEFNRLVSRMKDQEAAARVYDISGWENPDLGWASLHHFDGIGTPSSRQLRETYHIDRAVKGKRSQIEQQLALMDWVHRQWEHDGEKSAQKARALDILAEVAKGKRFACIDYAITLRDVLMAFGYPARVIGLQADGHSYRIGAGHSVIEVWNDELGKWILLDPQNNAVWRDGDRYLDAAEVRALIQAHKEGQLRFVRAASPWYRVGPDAAANDERSWSVYFYHLAYPLGEHGALLVVPGERLELLHYGEVERGGVIVSETSKIYPRLNRVHVDIEANETGGGVPSDVVTLHLSHSMPGFESYQIVDNGKPSGSKDPTLKWKLHSGKHVLTISAVNAAGIKGPPSRIELTYYPPARKPSASAQ